MPTNLVILELTRSQLREALLILIKVVILIQDIHQVREAGVFLQVFPGLLIDGFLSN